MFGIEDFTKKIVDFENFAPEQLSDALIFGGAVLLIGMLTVFSVLIILWLCLSVFKLCFSAKKSKKVKSTISEAPVQSTVGKTEEAEIVAVIAAAIAAAESESNGLKFKVVSFRRK